MAIDPIKLREAFQRIVVQGSSDNAEGYGPPYGPPWFVIDASTSEPEVNWPGDLISEHRTANAAEDARWQAIAEIVDEI